MNERIQELAEQAGFDSVSMVRFGIEQDLEKFAELVLQDVMNLFGDERISLHYLEQPCCEDSVYLLQSKIKEHFGVEE
jgi:DNA polymerase III delta subunit